MEYTITLPDTLTVESRTKSVDLDLRKIDESILVKAVLHGLTQKIADAAAGASQAAARTALGEEKFKSKANVKEWTGDGSNWAIIMETGKDMMQLVADRLADGDWGVVRSGGGAGVSPLVAKARQLAAVLIKGLLVKRDGNAKAYTGLNTGEKVATLDKYIAANESILVQAQKELDAMKAQAESVDLGQLGL